MATSCELQPCRSSNIPKTWLIRLPQPLPGEFRSNNVTFGHMRSFPVMWRPPPATYSPVKAKRHPNSISTLSTATSRLLPVKWCHFRVTSNHVRSRDVISCHVTATSCLLQPCKSSNVPKTRPIGLLQPLPGDFRSNHVTSGSLPVTWGSVMSISVR